MCCYRCLFLLGHRQRHNAVDNKMETTMTVKELRQFLRKTPSDYTIVDAGSLTEIIEQELHISDKYKMVIYKTQGDYDER